MELFRDHPHLFQVSRIGSSSIGYISIAENDHLPFEIKRVYWTYYTPNDVIRGNHAHRQLKQVLMAVSGQVIVNTIDKQRNEQSFTLAKPETAIYLPSMCWRTLQFSHNAVLVCLASEVYDESDYIRVYDDFLKNV